MKRSLQAVLKEFEAAGMDVDAMMGEVEDLIVKTLIAVQPSLGHVRPGQHGQTTMWTGI